jgi:hypothetical protein
VCPPPGVFLCKSGEVAEKIGDGFLRPAEKCKKVRKRDRARGGWEKPVSSERWVASRRQNRKTEAGRAEFDRGRNPTPGRFCVRVANKGVTIDELRKSGKCRT